MKKLFSLFVLFLGFSILASAQVPGQKLVPKPVLDAYAKDFPGVTPKRWEVKAGKNYEAVIVHNDKPCRARYHATGVARWVSYHWSGTTCPSTASAATLANFPGFKVDWATQTINKEKGTDRFLIRLSKPGHILKVYVNADGTVVTNGTEEDLQSEQENN